MIAYGICLSLRLVSLSVIISSCIHVAAHGMFHPFLQLSSIPLHICTTLKKKTTYWSTAVYTAVSVSAVQQSESAGRIHISPLFLNFLPI